MKLPETAMPRIPLLPEAGLTPEQQEVYDKVFAGPRGAVVGPLRAALHSPQLADRWQALGEYLRYRTSLGRRFSELAIIITGRFWNSQVEWAIHSEVALRAGLGADIIEAIRCARPPSFRNPAEAAIYDYVTQLLQFGTVDGEIHKTVHALLGTVGVVELTALIGYYTMVAMTLNAHQLPVPDGGAQQLLEAWSGPGLQPPTPLPARIPVEAGGPEVR